MKVLFENRASILIYNFLSSVNIDKPFLIPANICPIVPAIYLKAGLKFEFVDICLKTFTMQKEVIISTLKKNINNFSGMLWVNAYGASNKCEMFFKEIKHIKPDFIIIDDRCLQKPNFSSPKSYADIIIYSTGYSKYVDINWGGFGFLLNQNFSYRRYELDYALVDLELLNNEFEKSIRNKKAISYNDSNWLGNTSIKNSYNIYKKDILTRMENVKHHKRKLNKIYKENIKEEFQFESAYQNWRFNIFANQKEYLLKKIFSEGLFASSHYYPATLIYNQQFSPNAMKLHEHVVNLFNDFRFTADMALEVSNIVNKHNIKYGPVKLGTCI